MRCTIWTGIGAILLFASAASAGTIFEDDFESGLGQWTKKTTISFATIVADPKDATNDVLSFTGTNTAGDIFSKAIAVKANQDLTLSFDYLGLTNPIGGGIVGFNDGTLSGLTPPTNWIAAYTGNPGSYPEVMVDDGNWDRYTVTFNTGTYTSIRLVIEDWQGGRGTNAFFDNIEISVVPLPAAGWLGLGLLALLGAARRFRR